MLVFSVLISALSLGRTLKLDFKREARKGGAEEMSLAEVQRDLKALEKKADETHDTMQTHLRDCAASGARTEMAIVAVKEEMTRVREGQSNLASQMSHLSSAVLDWANRGNRPPGFGER